jgi:hypothetical protein
LNKKVLVGITLCKNLYCKLIRYVSLQHFLRIRKYIDQSAMSIPSISSHFKNLWMGRWVNVFSKVIYTNFKLFACHVIALQMENCSDGFNVPREHTVKLYIVEKRIMGSIGKFCSYEWEMVTFFSKIRVKDQISKSEKNNNKIKLPFFFKNPLLSENKMDIFYDNVTNDTIVVYFYRYVYTTHVKMASILNYLNFLKFNNKNLNGTYIQTGFCIFIFYNNLVADKSKLFSKLSCVSY